MIFLILFLALFLRLINLNQSLWFDEAINVVYASSSSFWWFVTNYPVGDFHPPGWFAILWVWGHIFGFSEISVRLPAVMLGTATVYLTYLLGKELFNNKVALFASIFLTIAPLHIYYSQEARMYTLAAFSATLSFYFLNRLTIGKKWVVPGYILSLVLILYSDYLSILVIPAQIIYLVWIKKLSKKALVNYLIAGVVFLPWMNIFLIQFQTGINKATLLPGWANVVGSSFKDLLLIPIKTFFGKVSFSDKTFYIIISSLVGIVFGSLFFRSFRKIDQATKLLICWIFMPVILAFLISFFVPVLAYFRMLFILPAVYLILAKSIESLPKRLALPAFVFICSVSILSLLGYYLYPKFQREDWRGAVNFVSENSDSQTLVIFENKEIPAPAKYYSASLSNFQPGLARDLETSLENKNKIFLFEYLVDVYDPNRLVEQKIKSLDFSQVKVYDFQGVGFIKLYVK